VTYAENLLLEGCDELDMQLEWRNKCIHRHSAGWPNAQEVTT